MAKKSATEIGSVSNDVTFDQPYAVLVQIRGTADLLFHRWSNEDVAEKAASAKGSKAKKIDNLEAYVYRNDEKEICLPGEYLRQSMIHAAKFRQDPRSPRKSAMDLVKAGIICLTELAPLGSETWDYEDKRRVTIQRAGITRTRPAFKKGWGAEFILQVLLPEYIDADFLHDLVSQAGKLIGVGDFRPSYGRFVVTRFEVINEEEIP